MQVYLTQQREKQEESEFDNSFKLMDIEPLKTAILFETLYWFPSIFNESIVKKVTEIIRKEVDRPSGFFTENDLHDFQNNMLDELRSEMANHTASTLMYANPLKINHGTTLYTFRECITGQDTWHFILECLVSGNIVKFAIPIDPWKSIDRIIKVNHE